MLAKITTDKGKEVYINPVRVIAVYPSKDYAVVLLTDDASFHIPLEDINKVTRDLDYVEVS